jgi:hypothetical protein
MCWQEQYQHEVHNVDKDEADNNPFSRLVRLIPRYIIHEMFFIESRAFPSTLKIRDIRSNDEMGTPIFASKPYFRMALRTLGQSP